MVEKFEKNSLVLGGISSSYCIEIYGLMKGIFVLKCNLGSALGKELNI
jgi:hypothetical protein